jgi:hypothetical protein
MHKYIFIYTKGSELIEQTLLSEAQNWTKGGVLNTMVCEDTEVYGVYIHVYVYLNAFVFFNFYFCIYSSIYALSGD